MAIFSFAFCEIVIVVSPTGAERHFWLPPIKMSTLSSSKFISSPPIAETESTMVKIPLLFKAPAISFMLFVIPDGVSQ